jgi:site-specific DNA-methyltransferase (adenine-specific)
MTAKSEVHLIDCMEFLRSVPDKFYSLACVDPPYGMPKSSAMGAGKLKNRIFKGMQKKGWDIAPDKEYFDELMRVSKNQIIWGGNYFHLPPTRGFLIWDKEQPWENFSSCEFAWTSFDRPSKIFKEATTRTGENKIHPTQKSINLYDWILSNYAKPNDTILDTHMGSQSSRISAHKAGLNFTGCELDPEYFEQGNERFHKYLLKSGTSEPDKAMPGQQINIF